MAILLGAIEDDFTGATDLCNTLVGEGLRTVRVIAVPDETTEIGEADAVVVALKTPKAPVKASKIRSASLPRRSAGLLAWVPRRWLKSIALPLIPHLSSVRLARAHHVVVLAVHCVGMLRPDPILLCFGYR